MGLQGLVLIQPFFGGEERTPSEKIDNFPLINVELLDWFWRSYLPVEADRDHPASHVSGSHLADVEIPPMLVLVGGQDLLRDWNMRYVDEMKKAGKKVQLCFYEDAVHLFGQLNQAVVGEQMLNDIATWLHSHQG
jgi:gibberellin receptor GID1